VFLVQNTVEKTSVLFYPLVPVFWIESSDVGVGWIWRRTGGRRGLCESDGRDDDYDDDDDDDDGDR
jgi:hypothetical protein